MASSVIRPPKWFYGLDLNGICENWITADSGSEVRMQNKAIAPMALAQAINHLHGFCPRVIFSKALPFGSAYNSATNDSPHVGWYYRDDPTNYRENTYSIIWYPPWDGNVPTNRSYFQRWTDISSPALDNATKGPERTTGSSASALSVGQGSEDIVIQSRGAASGALKDEGISVYEYYSPAAITVQAMPVTGFVSGTHTYCPWGAKPGDPVLGNTDIELLRSQLHDVRIKNLPIISWSAYRGGSWDTTMSGADTGGSRGVRIDGTTYKNILNFGTGGWAVSAPGFVVHAQYCGVGPITKTAGKQLRLDCYVLAASSTGTGKVKFTTSIGNTEVDVASSTTDWCGVENTNKVYVDTSVPNDDDDNAARPLVVVEAKASGAAAKIYVYGISLVARYGA